jgi:hypothetical protein
VGRATRDLLVQQARDQETSVAALVGEMAEQYRRETIYASEREATRSDEQNPDAKAELSDWDHTLEDGVA